MSVRAMPASSLTVIAARLLPGTRIRNSYRRTTGSGRFHGVDAGQGIVETTIHVDRHRSLAATGHQEILQQPVLTGAMPTGLRFGRGRQPIADIARRLLVEGMPAGLG